MPTARKQKAAKKGSKGGAGPADHASLLRLFKSGKPRIGVIGLGYVGLPLALTFAEAGLEVIGFDIDSAKCDAIEKGQTYLSTIPSPRIKKAVSSGLMEATIEFEKLAACDAVIICVPTPLGTGREPDLKYVRMTAEQIAGELRHGQLVVLESTTWPGTTREVVKPILDRSNLQHEDGYWLAFSPEREDPGNPDYTTRTIPKVVGGLGAKDGDLAEAMYARAFTTVVRVSSAEVAESAKLLENIYRAVNIALVNELKVVFEAMNLDVWEIINAAKTKPFGYQAFYPGPGLGGHCIPIDPFYLTWRAAQFGVKTQFIELAGDINSSMPHRVLHRVQDVLNQAAKPIRGARIMVLGVAFKANVSDTRESPGIELIALLRERGAAVYYHDPLVPVLEPVRRHDVAMRSTPLTEKAIRGVDLVLLATNQPGMDLGLVARHAKIIVDTRNAFEGFKGAKVVKA